MSEFKIDAVGPSTPPEGYRLMPENYVARDGDLVWYTSGSGKWENAYRLVGENANSLNEKRPFAKHYFASPIPVEVPE